MSNDSLHFENVGLFLGLLSYPYYQDGKILYGKLETFFSKHKEQIWSFEPCNNNDDVLYKPAGYRLFGSHGLAVLSLVDDYTFYNRHFNKNHIQTVLDDCEKKESNNEREKKEDEELNFNSTVISGVSEIGETEGVSLIEKAQNTFLKKDDERFHYIGIIRLKINHDFLLEEKGNNGGIQVLRDIKTFINEQLKEKCNIQEYIAVDCFDNDEMTIIAFSNNLLNLYNFLGEIRSITNKPIGVKCSEKVENSGNEVEVEKHVFGTALLCFGYDVKYDPSNDTTIKDIQMNCLIETKTGHRDVFCKHLESQKNNLKISQITKIITGGCSVVVTLNLNTIVEIENRCRKDEAFLKNVRRMKVVLWDTEKDRLESLVGENHVPYNNQKKYEIDKTKIEKVKGLMKKIGLSKLVRERLMALFELYNHSCQNLLQQFYLKELLPTMQGFQVMIEGMRRNNEPIREIEEALNIEINNMENAIYDRLHPQKHNQPPLEYSGGIQQHLTAFDYAYKSICAVFSPKETGYVTITGAERASSERYLFNLNINDIFFPELFITTAWKEVANFAVRLIDGYSSNTIIDGYARDFFVRLKNWHQFSQNEDAFNNLRYNIIHSGAILPKDTTSEIAVELMDREQLMYFFKDYVVFHFAFLENYEMMWYYYFKTMLQTTICYRELNVVYRKHFVHMLIRLFMVGLLSSDTKNELFIKEQESKPYDHLVSDFWMKDFKKAWEITKVIYANLEQYGFKQMNDDFICYMETNIDDLPFGGDDLEHEISIVLNKRINKRKNLIVEMKKRLQQGHLIENTTVKQKDYIICLFYAYLETVYELDDHNKTIKSIPRNLSGDIVHFNDQNKMSFFSNSIKILVDSTGGFFVPSSETRKQYFLLRTVLYRSLWNYRFTNTLSLS